MRNISIGLVLLAALYACSSAPQPKAVTASGGSVVTLKNAELTFPKGTTFSWSEAASHFYDDERIDDARIREALGQAIKSNLKERGYRVVDTDGDYEIAFVTALAGSLSDMEINKRFGVNPGMLGDSSDTNAYDKGTVIADVIDPTSGESLWRSALQAYVVFDLEEAVRKERIEKAVTRLFGSFPVAQ
ncbi:MAG: DUF4136 domain-containing protein [Desulfuromonadales bacterium]|nr:DUF4136 domain-containing protein [Desulfuromonadales bacterium]